VAITFLIETLLSWPCGIDDDAGNNGKNLTIRPVKKIRLFEVSSCGKLTV
jgi:hypothetical protein